jgi:hypothetical protein
MMRTGTARRGASSWRAGIDSSRDRLVLLEMALAWLRLAEYAAKAADSQGVRRPYQLNYFLF